MTPPVTHTDTPAWSGTHVTIAEVVSAVENLRRSEVRAATRTSVATLIIVTRTTDELDEAETVIEHLGVRHPARIITLLAAPDAGTGEDRVDADVVMHAGQAAGHAIWSDELRLRVSGGPARHLASLLRPLQLSDLPVVVWYVKGLPDPKDPLLKLANAIVVDSKTATDPGEGEPAMLRTFASITELCRRHTLIDLSWSRLALWRRLLALQFQGDVFGPLINGVERVEIVGKMGPRTLLAGWLSSRLALPRESMHLYDGRHVAVSMYSELNGQRGEIKVERLGQERLVRATATIEGGPSHSDLLSLPGDALPLSLADSLRNTERDKIYELAIKTIGAWS